jgi:hypothetical protein
VIVALGFLRLAPEVPGVAVVSVIAVIVVEVVVTVRLAVILEGDGGSGVAAARAASGEFVMSISDLGEVGVGVEVLVGLGVVIAGRFGFRAGNMRGSLAERVGF